MDVFWQSLFFNRRGVISVVAIMSEIPAARESPHHAAPTAVSPGALFASFPPLPFGGGKEVEWRGDFLVVLARFCGVFKGFWAFLRRFGTWWDMFVTLLELFRRFGTFWNVLGFFFDFNFIPNTDFNGHHPIIPVRVKITPTTAIMKPLSTRQA